MNDSQPPLDEKFKDTDDPLRLVFVCAMWLTGLKMFRQHRSPSPPPSNREIFGVVWEYRTRHFARESAQGECTPKIATRELGNIYAGETRVRENSRNDLDGFESRHRHQQFRCSLGSLGSLGSAVP
jgi:hypothetical protein